MSSWLSIRIIFFNTLLKENSGISDCCCPFILAVALHACTAHLQIDLWFELMGVDTRATTESRLVGDKITRVCPYFGVALNPSLCLAILSPHRSHKAAARLWSEEPFSFSGSHYVLPVQKHFFLNSLFPKLKNGFPSSHCHSIITSGNA